MRKVRLWICYQCKKVYRRKRKEDPVTCRTCNKLMTAARRWPSPKWFESRDKKQEQKQKKEDVLEKRISVPRDSHGRVLHITTKARQIWRRIEKLKQRPAFERYAREFIEEIHKNCIHRLGINGMCNPPEITWVKNIPEAYGHYQVHMLRGLYCI